MLVPLFLIIASALIPPLYCEASLWDEVGRGLGGGDLSEEKRTSITADSGLRTEHSGLFTTCVTAYRTTYGEKACAQGCARQGMATKLRQYTGEKGRVVFAHPVVCGLR